MYYILIFEFVHMTLINKLSRTFPLIEKNYTNKSIAKS